MGTRSNQDAGQRVVVGVPAVVALGLGTHCQRAHPQGSHEVPRPEHQRHHARAGRCDGIDRGEPRRVLNLRLNPDRAFEETVAAFQLPQHHVQRFNLPRRLYFGQDNRVDRCAAIVRSPGDAGHDVNKIHDGVLGVPGVDPQRHLASGEPPGADGGHHILTGLLLGRARNGVFEVQEDLVGGEREGFVQHLLTRTRYR